MEDSNIKRSRKELNEYKNSLKLTKEQHEVLVGGLLGDLSLNKIGNYSRLVVEQKNKEYLFHLYEIFKDFVRTPPKERLQKRLITSEVKSTWYFSTISHPDFEEYYKLFYKDKIKIIPLNLKDLITVRGLAYWFMDDGTRNKGYYKISTCCFTLEEHNIILDAFLVKFDLQVSLTKYAKYYEIHLSAKNNANKKFKLLIESFIIDSMKYKII